MALALEGSSILVQEDAARGRGVFYGTGNRL